MLAFGSGIHGAAAFLFRGKADGTPPSLADVQASFEGYRKLETNNRPIRFGEKDTKESLLALAGRMVEVLHKDQEPGTEIVSVEQPLDVPLIDLDTREVLDRAQVGTLDLIERNAEDRIVVVDLKTSARCAATRRNHQRAGCSLTFARDGGFRQRISVCFDRVPTMRRAEIQTARAHFCTWK